MTSLKGRGEVTLMLYSVACIPAISAQQRSEHISTAETNGGAAVRGGVITLLSTLDLSSAEVLASVV
jgi:hypothetical protein